MSPLLEQMKAFTKHMTEEVTALFTHESKKIRVKELIPLITKHKYVTHSQRQLLGLTFNTYEIGFESILIKVVTKGKNDQQILEVTFRSQEHSVFSYKSYERTHSLKDDIQLPKTLLTHLSTSR